MKMNRNFFLSLTSALAVLTGMSFYVRPAAATLITFDDLTDNGLGLR
jgi:hypothetical protein